MLRNNNVVARIFQRQIQTPPPGTSVHCARRFYENLVPNFTIYDVECPDHSFRKFTDDGQYLISFSRNLLDLIVYRPTWLSYSYKEEDYHLPSRAKRFDSFFTQLYCVSLASSNEVICKDFFLYVNTNQFGLFATSTSQIHDAPAIGGAIQGVPSIERITFHLLRLEDGVILDEKVFYNDFINLAHNMGVFLYDDLLAVVSLRYQTIYILQIRESGNLVDVRAIGAFCREDDELFLNSNMADNSKLHQSSGNHVDIAVHSNQLNSDNSFLSGIKQRLLSFIFQGIWSEETDKFQVFSSSISCLILLHRTILNILQVFLHSNTITLSEGPVLEEEILFPFSRLCRLDYLEGEVQFLDRHHLLIKFGSVDGGVRLFMLSTTRIMSKEEGNSVFQSLHLSSDGCYYLFLNTVEIRLDRVLWELQVSRSADHHASFFAVYNMETTEIVAFYQNSADELYLLFEQFCDHFYAMSRNSSYMNFISSHSNNIHAREQLRSIKNKASSLSQFVKKMLTSLPFSCQSLSPSPYFDQSLFRYDEKLISATDRHRPSTDHPIKFISRRQPHTLKFKIKPGPEAGSLDGRTKKVSSFLFHPFLPLALSIQQTLFLQSSVNIHFRG
ncbi:hypothetical protein DKX38_020347 [Salix brachista]|uniref:Light-mediated development protein DET1 n=2 Tax=Salix TaxID=40685 RepID=A0A5N5KJ07_9ROSI|nr:hypothetical protein DKX38_020347 [Salix brachista]